MAEVDSFIKVKFIIKVNINFIALIRAIINNFVTNTIVKVNIITKVNIIARVNNYYYKESD